MRLYAALLVVAVAVNVSATLADMRLVALQRQYAQTMADGIALSVAAGLPA